MKLVEEFVFRLGVPKSIPIGEGPFGNRVIHENSDGEITGERIRGKLLGGTDWSLIGPDGFLRIDYRGQIETHDGAILYIQYQGLLELSEILEKSLEEGKGTEFEDQYCVISLRMETGDERYNWVNRTVFIGEGRALPNGSVEYRILRAAH